MIPEGWNTYQLGDVCDIKGRIGWRGYTVEDLRNDGPLALGAGQIATTHTLDLSQPVHISREKFDESPEIKVEKDDILVVKVGSTIGKVAIIKKDIGDACINPNTVLLKRIKCNPYFLYYTLISPKGQHFLQSNSTASAQPALNQSTLKLFKFLLPEKKTQDSLANILNSLDDKIELNLQMNKTLEAIAQAIYKEWFVDFRFPGFDGELVDGLPKGWRKGIIADIYNTTSGGTPSRVKEEFYINGTIRWVKSKELNGGFIFDTEEKITEEALQKSSAKMIPRHSILIAMYGATVGEHGILSEVATCNQAICAIIPNDNYPYTFILSHLRLNMNKIIDQASGSAQQNISQALIQRQPIIIPPSKVVNEYNETVAPLFARVENNILSNSSLSQIRDILIPKLMTGKIKVT